MQTTGDTDYISALDAVLGYLAYRIANDPGDTELWEIRDKVLNHRQECDELRQYNEGNFVHSIGSDLTVQIEFLPEFGKVNEITESEHIPVKGNHEYLEALHESVYYLIPAHRKDIIREIFSAINQSEDLLPVANPKEVARIEALIAHHEAQIAGFRQQLENMRQGKRDDKSELDAVLRYKKQ